MTDKRNEIPDSVLDHAVVGLNLRAGSLREELGNDLTLLAFLRHFG